MSSGLIQVFTYELKRQIRRRGFLFTTFGLPVVILVLMLGFNAIQTANAANEEDSEPDTSLTDALDFEGIERAGVIDLSGLFSDTPDSIADVIVRYEDTDAAREALLAGEIDVYYVIEEDYLETGEVVQHVPGLALSLFNSVAVQELIFNEIAQGDDLTLLRRLQNPASFDEINLERRAANNADTAGDAATTAAAIEAAQDADFLVVYIFTIAFLLGLFLTNGYLMQSVITEKENRLVEILISTVRPIELLGGKILALGILGIMQIVVWALGLVLLFNVAQTLPAFESFGALSSIQLPVDQFPVMFLYFVGGYLFFAGIYGGIGALSNSMSEGPQYAAIFTLPVALPFYFFPLFLETPNATAPTIMSIAPVTSPIAMLMRLSITEVPLWQIGLSLFFLALSVVFAIWIAARLFRVQSLLSGQAPKLREIPALILGRSSSPRKAKTAEA